MVSTALGPRHVAIARGAKSTYQLMFTFSNRWMAPVRVAHAQTTYNLLLCISQCFDRDVSFHFGSAVARV